MINPAAIYKIANIFFKAAQHLNDNEVDIFFNTKTKLYKLLSENNTLHTFKLLNNKTLKDLISGSHVEYIGSGLDGDAYKLTNISNENNDIKVLKIYKNSPGIREYYTTLLNMSSDKEKEILKSEPIIFDHGDFISPETDNENSTFHYVILEYLYVSDNITYNINDKTHSKDNIPKLPFDLSEIKKLIAEDYFFQDNILFPIKTEMPYENDFSRFDNVVKNYSSQINEFTSTFKKHILSTFFSNPLSIGSPWIYGSKDFEPKDIKELYLRQYDLYDHYMKNTFGDTDWLTHLIKGIINQILLSKNDIKSNNIGIRPNTKNLEYVYYDTFHPTLTDNRYSRQSMKNRIEESDSQKRKQKELEAEIDMPTALPTSAPKIPKSKYPYTSGPELYFKDDDDFRLNLPDNIPKF